MDDPRDAETLSADAEMARRSGSFGAVADLYERFRPGPPLDVVEWLVPTPVGRVVDLGAGTGALTRLLVARADEVIAVEPDERMRAVLGGVVPSARAVDGRGESIPVGDGSVDAAMASSSWHWMDPEPTLREVARVLRPGGALGVVWTGPDPEGPFMTQAADALTRAGEDDEHGAEFAVAVTGTVGEMTDRLEIPAGLGFGPVERHTVRWDIPLNSDDLIGLLGTMSWVILMSDDQHERTFATARRLLHDDLGIAGDVTVDVKFRAAAFRAFRD
jgi:SAM-dependent methyltransferase